jgi:hypothetical protein
MQVGLSSGVQKNPERRGHRPLLDWLRYLRTRRGAGDYTHLCMDGAFGGMLTVPPQLETEFLQKYAEEIDAGSAFSAEQATSRMYICESKTPFFKFFVDVDFSLADPLYYVAADKKKVVCRVVSIVVKSFFAGLADDAFIMMVADTSSFEGAPAPEEEQGDPAHGPLVRVGGRARSSNMHVHFPSLVVDQQQAVTMGAAIAAKLREIFGPLSDVLAKGWDDVVDSSVYAKNGLRMVGSRKCGNCTLCRNKERGPACRCLRGRVDLGKVYKLRWVLEGKRNFVDHPALRNTAAMLQGCSVRSSADGPTPGWVGPPSSNKRKAGEMEGGRKDKGGKKGAKGEEEDQGEQGRFYSSLRRVDRGAVVFRVAQAEIRASNPLYANVNLKDLKVSDGGGYYRANLSGAGGRSCQNLEDPVEGHRNTQVYMIIKASGLYQRCYCTCKTTKHRKHGQCRDYRSDLVALSAEGVSKLFR